MITFKTSKPDRELIRKIVDRAEQLEIVQRAKQGRKSRFQTIYDRMSCDMDITACHANGNPIDLA